MRWALCPDCNKPMEVEYVNNGVCMVWHGVHCGWGQTGFADDDVFDTPEEASASETHTPGGTMSTTLSVEEAQEALAKHWSPSYAGPVGRAFEALARAAAREEIARSSAPVGEDAYMQAVAAGCYALDDAPTPPAKDTGEVEAGASVIHETISYMIAKAAESDGLRQRLAEAHADARAAWDCCELRRKEAEAGQTRIADLEARLAEAKTEIENVTHDMKRAFDEKAAAERERDEARSSLETAERRIGELEAFAKSFSVSVNESSFYKDVTLHLVEPHALSIRLANSKSDKAWIFADLEARRLAALTPDAGTARSEDEEE